MAAISYLCKKRVTRNVKKKELSKRILTLKVDCNYREYLPSVMNTKAHRASRLKKDSSERKLNPPKFQNIWKN